MMSCRVETTPAPRTSRFNSKDFKNHVISSSFDDSYFNNMNLFRQLAATNRNNVVTVGNCGMSTVNFSQFLSCLGMTVQETTTLTATFTETTTFSDGYNTMTVVGCTPSGFSYPYCPSSSTQVQQTSQIDDRPKFRTRTEIGKRPVVGKSIPKTVWIWDINIILFMLCFLFLNNLKAHWLWLL